MKSPTSLLPPMERASKDILPPEIIVPAAALKHAVAACKGQHLEGELAAALRKMSLPVTLPDMLTMCRSLPCRLADKFLLALAEHTGCQLLNEMQPGYRALLDELAEAAGWEQPVHLLMRWLVGDCLSGIGIRRLRYHLRVAA